jgi:hypothetical protein
VSVPEALFREDLLGCFENGYENFPPEALPEGTCTFADWNGGYGR